MLRWRRFQSEEIRSEYRRKFIWRVCLTLLLLVVLFVGMRELTRMRALAWDSVDVRGASNISARSVYDAVMPYLVGYRGGVIARSNRFALNKKDIADELMEVFPRIESVTVDGDNGQIVIDITERVAVAVACESESREKCLLVDANGYQFDRAELLGDLFVYYAEPQLRDYVLPTEQFLAITTLQEQLNRLDLYSRSMTLLPSEMQLMLRNGTYVRFGYDELDRQLGNLTTIIRSPEYKKTVLEEGAEVLYFDLRFGDRVFYKLKEE